MQKNDLVTVAIEDIGVGGEGIGKVDGYTLFIKDAIIGDVVEAKIVKAKKNYGYARLMNIVTPSENRVEKPACPMARRCGGCQIQEMKYGAQLAFKEGKVRGNLERIGEVPTELLDKVMQPIVGMEEPFHYRNKAQFPIGTDKEGNEISLLDIIESPPVDIVENYSTQQDILHLLSSIKSILSPKEYQVICYRYGIFNEPELTQREIAARLDISRSYVSRIEKNALRKLRTLFH